MRPVAVFHDPTNRPDYVRRYVEVLDRQWGIDAVLLYPHHASRFLVAQADAVIGRQAVAARLTGDLSDVKSIADFLRRRFDVVAAIPQAENQVLPSARLADLLGIGRVPFEVVSRFRDKHSLKEYVRAQPGAPRVNRSCLVAAAEQAVTYAEQHGLQRFVLKPNDGSGNSRIAFFDGDARLSTVAQYFTENAHDTILLEEYIGGGEYTVNGQVDAEGTVRTFSVQRRVYIAANGRSNLGGGYRMVAHTTGEFAQAEAYARGVLTTAGLVASPFHMEIKIDEEGPSLIEVGARLGGAGIPEDTALAHGGAIDLFLESARGFVGEVGPVGQPDWEHYDEAGVWTVLGVADHDERITRLDGVEQVQALPEFAYWVMPPQLGQRVRRTIDLATSPWQVTLRGAADRLPAVENSVREAIRWNDPAGGPMRRVRARAAWVHRRFPMAAQLVRPGPVEVA